MSKTKIVLLGLLAMVLLIALAIGSEFGGLAWKGYFKPKHQAVERKVFTESKSYVLGKAQELGKLYGEYQLTTDVEKKKAITALVRIKFSEFNDSNISNETLRVWLVGVMGYQIP